jgi:hypothetical protein
VLVKDALGEEERRDEEEVEELMLLLSDLLGSDRLRGPLWPNHVCRESRTLDDDKDEGWGVRKLLLCRCSATDVWSSWMASK